MNNERDPEDVEEELDSEEEDDTVKVRRSGDDDDDVVDNVGDMSVEINIEELVSKLDATDDDDVARRRAIKRRIEELREIRDAERDLESTYNFDFEEDDD